MQGTNVQRTENNSAGVGGKRPKPTLSRDENGQIIGLIPLSRGLTAIVDEDDFAEISRYNWHVEVVRWQTYAARRVTVDGNLKHIFMHRQIMKLPEEQFVDHKDMDGLNNRRRNLRPCTNAQNLANSRLRSTNKSGFKGVSWHKRYHCWQATITVNGKDYWLGRYDDPVSAAKAYNEAASQYFGEFARINSIPEENKTTG